MHSSTTVKHRKEAPRKLRKASYDDFNHALNSENGIEHA
jgi:hypothetical protein